MPKSGCKSTIAIGNWHTLEIEGPYRCLHCKARQGNWEDLTGILLRSQRFFQCPRLIFRKLPNGCISPDLLSSSTRKEAWLREWAPYNVSPTPGLLPPCSGGKQGSRVFLLNLRSSFRKEKYSRAKRRPRCEFNSSISCQWQFQEMLHGHGKGQVGK